MCPPGEHLTFLQRLQHDFHNSYYQVATIYIAAMVTIIAIFVIIGPVG